LENNEKIKFLIQEKLENLIHNIMEKYNRGQIEEEENKDYLRILANDINREFQNIVNIFI
jgi:hypothetical protein